MTQVIKHNLIKPASGIKQKIAGLLQITVARAIVLGIFGFGTRLQIKREGLTGIKPPFVVLGNHSSNLDPALVQVVFSAYPCYFLTSNYYFRLPIVGALLRFCGAIPKIQFYPDSRSLRRAVAVIAGGGVLGIFPEGRRSIDGSCCPITDSVAKLLKKLAVPVLTVTTHGGYFVWPRWSPLWRSSRVETVVRQLFSVEELASMDVDEIYGKIRSALTYNDYRWNRQAGVKLRNENIAENLHLILHQCPRCFSVQAMRSKNNRLTCRVCGNTALMDESGFLFPADETNRVFADPVQWNAWQRKNMLAWLQKEKFSLRVRVTKLYVADKFVGAYRRCGSGEMILDPAGIKFLGKVDGKSSRLFFPAEMIPAISTEFKTDFELCDNTCSWRFFLAEEQRTIQIETAISLLYEQNNGLRQPIRLEPGSEETVSTIKQVQNRINVLAH